MSSTQYSQGCCKFKHGESSNPSPEYTAWRGMTNRCLNENDPTYERYGKRGISVCPQWLGDEGFANFLSSMGRRPSPDHSVDRINNLGNYEPGNCRWATDSMQCRNRRSNRLISFNGKTMTLVEWSAKTGINRRTIAWRLMHGWPIELALS